jgi:hypothetical protein
VGSNSGGVGADPVAFRSIHAPESPVLIPTLLSGDVGGGGVDAGIDGGSHEAVTERGGDGEDRRSRVAQ